METKFKINTNIKAIYNSGYLTIPVQPGQKQTYYHWSRVHKENYNLSKVWIGQPLDANCAILCEDIVSIVDFDAHSPEPNGMTVYRKFEQAGIFENCIIERTHSDGRHVYFKGIQGKRYIVQIDGVNIEVKCGRNLVYCYPSVTPNGSYTFLTEQTLLNTRPEDLPELPAIFARPAKPVYEGPKSDLNAVSNGQIDATLEHYYDRALEDAKIKGRNNTGFWLACQLRDAGLKQDHAHPWMIDYQEDVDDPNNPYTISEVVTSLESAYNEPPREPALVKNYNPYPKFIVRSMQEVISNPTKVSYLVEGWVVTGSKVLVAGPPKTVKTLLADDLAVSIASGKPFLGHYKINQTGPVLVYQGENNEAVEGDRFKRLKKVKGVTEDIPVYYIGNQGLHLNDSRSVERLTEAIEAVKPIMVIIDPLYASFDGDISQQKEVTPVLNQLTSICDNYHCAVVLVTHTNKSANGKSSPKIPDINTFGSQYLLAWYECGMFIGNSKDDSDGTDMGDTLITDMLNMVQPPKVINVRRAGRSMGTMQIVTVSVDFNDPEIISIDVEPFKDTVVRNKSKDMSKVLGAVFSVLGNEKMPMMVLTEETVKYLKSDRSIKKGKGKNAVMYAIHYAIDEGTLYEKYEGTTKLIAKKHEPIHA